VTPAVLVEIAIAFRRCRRDRRNRGERRHHRRGVKKSP
jgi:hypothetical protein